MVEPIALTVFQGRAGDHNDRAIPGAASIGRALAKKLGLEPLLIGVPEPALNLPWEQELHAAMPALQAMVRRCESIYRMGLKPITASSRCAVSLATLPPVAKFYPDVSVVWFDSHPDLNTPETSGTGYLGGLALAGPAGLWDSGLGAGIDLAKAVLVGERDIDPVEQDLIDRGICKLIPPGAGMAGPLKEALKGRRIYIHIDCDVLNPGIVPTDYRHEGGLTLADLHAACAVMAECAVVGLEIAEFENTWEPGGEPVSPTPLLEACEPVIQTLICPMLP